MTYRITCCPMWLRALLLPRHDVPYTLYVGVLREDGGSVKCLLPAQQLVWSCCRIYIVCLYVRTCMEQEQQQPLFHTYYTIILPYGGAVYLFRPFPRAHLYHPAATSEISSTLACFSLLFPETRSPLPLVHFFSPPRCSPLFVWDSSSLFIHLLLCLAFLLLIFIFLPSSTSRSHAG